jgi:pimeloyl-ACP methyl ester carboxylesterase
VKSGLVKRKSRASLKALIYCALIPFVSAGSSVAASDPYPAKMTRLTTGSELAVWRLAPTAEKARETPIVFLHGGPGLYTEARRFREGQIFRDRGFETVYFDQLGGGKSGRVPAAQYSIDRLIADLEALRVSLGKERMILWGNSFGAGLAAVYASRYPNRVAAVILTSPGAFPGTSVTRNYGLTNRDKVEYSKEIRAAINRIDKEGPAAESTLTQDRAGQLFDEMVSSELVSGVVCKGSPVPVDPLPGGGNLFSQRIFSRQMGKVKIAMGNLPKVSALIVHGGCDFLPMTNAERFRAAFAGELVSLPATGHGLLENRDKVERAIMSFIDAKLSALP